MEEKTYCPFCGAENSAEQKHCSACGKPLHPQPYGLKDYLYDTTKRELQGKLEDTFFTVLKNWILSHAYGLVVTIALISLGTVIVQGNSLPSYIERWQGAAPGSSETVQQPKESTNTIQTEGLSEEDEEQIYELPYRYDLLLDITERGVIVDDEELGSSQDPASLLLPEEYGERGNTAFVSSGYIVQEIRAYSVHTDLDILTVNDPIDPIGKALSEKGYPVVEAVYSEDFYGEDETTVLHSRSHRFTFVKADGNWYIAEIVEEN